MSKQDDPVKKLLFDYITRSEEIEHLASQKKFEEMAKSIVAGCYNGAVRIGDREESVGVLATGILHYLLTCALIPSQRKVVLDRTDIDIIVPNLKTLRAESERALLVCIPCTQDVSIIREKLASLQKIQPKKQNIWLVLSRDLEFENRTFVISKDGQAFSKVITEISRFADIYCQNKFRILRA